jgi:hypothetical protein
LADKVAYTACARRCWAIDCGAWPSRWPYSPWLSSQGGVGT